MKIKNKSWLLGSALILSPFFVNAQAPTFSTDLDSPKSTKENVPYSMYGVGSWLENNHAITRGMGGAGIAQREKGSINFKNPASVVFLENITLDFALEGRQNTFHLGNDAHKAGATSLSYLGLGLPFNKNVGVSLSFQPMTNMYYFAQDHNNTEILGNHLITHRGEGGLNKAQIAVAGQWKGFAVGVDLGYLFGNFEKVRTLQSKDANTSLVNSAFINKQQVGGFYWSAGAQYHKPLKKDKFLDVGLTARVQQDFNINHDHYSISSAILGEKMLLDTITSNEGLSGELSLPATYGLGLAYGKEGSWKVLLDALYTDWQQFSFLNDRRGVTKQAMAIHLGTQFSPSKDRDKVNYFHLIDYRAGIYFKQDYLELEGGQFQSIGGSIGLSLPIRRTYNHFAKIHLTFDAGQRSSNIPTLGTENYIKATVGFSLNDVWFVRPKYD